MIKITQKTDFPNQSARALSGPAMKSMSVYFPIKFKCQNYFSKFFDNVSMNCEPFTTFSGILNWKTNEIEYVTNKINVKLTDK